MAGHSKFKNIMHRKGAQDKKRASLFNKLAREVTVAARSGPDPSFNPALRSAIAAARAENMPKERIERAIQSGSPDGDGADYEEVRYEGFGPGGVAMIIEALTDNRNRTVADIRMLFTKNGGTLGESNSVSFMFERRGEILYPLAIGDADTVFEKAAEAGAENVETTDDTHVIQTTVEDFSTVRDALVEAFDDATSGRLVWVPLNTTAPNTDQAKTLLKLLDLLDDHDDVQQVYTNADIPDAVLETL